MQTLRRILVLAPFSLLAAGCDGDPSAPVVEPITGLPRVLSAAETRVIDGSNGFAFGLLREARAAGPGPNTFVSPLSVSMALGMTMNGAAGDSWTQLRDALGFAGMEEPAVNAAYRDLRDLLLALDPTVDMAVGNALWSDAHRVTFLPEFVQRIETYFDAEAATLDFSNPGARDVINGWVADLTRGRIQELIDVIPPDAVAYLVNAIYFLADWRTQFDGDRTRPGSFTRSDGSTVTAPFMAGDVGYRVFGLGDPAGPQGVELPYGGGAFTGVAVLPPVGQGIDEFLAGLDVARWSAWMDAFDAAAETEDLDRPGTAVELPKFELAWKDDLVEALKALGVEDIFLANRADLSRMNGQRDLFVTRVLHQTYVRVDERGTEAAAATAVEIGRTSAPSSLRFERPFLFVIRERYSGTILFAGVIGDPAEEGEG